MPIDAAGQVSEHGDVEPSQSLPLVRTAFQEHKAWLPPVRMFTLAGSALLAALLAALLYSKAAQFIAQDRCLDSGSRWESRSSTCWHVAQ